MSLQIQDDIGFHRRNWWFERVGWSLLALLLAAAALGFLGPGLFSRFSRVSPDGRLRLESQRFVRASASQQIRLLVSPERSGEGRFGVWLETSYLSAVTVRRVTPEPDVVRAGAERMTFEFSWDGSAGAVPLVFEVEPREAGWIGGRAGIDATSLEIRQLVFP